MNLKAFNKYPLKLSAYREIDGKKHRAFVPGVDKPMSLIQKITSKMNLEKREVLLEKLKKVLKLNDLKEEENDENKKGKEEVIGLALSKSTRRG